ncbi:hypothetical protein [Hydrogenophaga luteola]|uniref:DNA transfer protein n=1 Tax=Hydrogenophaga luteola TaxID=1591122 RepID=A0ABV7WCI4_9BURK
MSAIFTAVATVAVGAYSADQARNSANRATAAGLEANAAALAQSQQQFEASQRLQQSIAAQQMATQRHIAGMQIGEYRRQFAEVQKVLAPFITAGNEALGPLKQYQATGLEAMGDQRDLLGMNGTQAQQAAISGLSNSPEMAAYLQQGEGAILQNAAATGGLRGGNTQAALAQFRPSLLAGMISQQYDRLGGLASIGVNTSSMLYQTGQSAAAGQANAGMQVAGQVGSALAGYSEGVGNAYGTLARTTSANSAGMAGAYNQYYNNLGSMNAGNALAIGSANQGFANTVAGALGSYSFMQQMKGSGMGSNPSTAGLAASYTGGGGYSLASGYQGGGLGLKASF